MIKNKKMTEYLNLKLKSHRPDIGDTNGTFPNCHHKRFRRYINTQIHTHTRVRVQRST